MKRKQQERKRCGAKNDKDEREPADWTKLFQQLKKDAERRYPDGRVQIILPTNKRRPRLKQPKIKGDAP